MAQEMANDGSGAFGKEGIPGFPGGEAELDAFLKLHQVTDKGREFLMNALTGPPERRVGSGNDNVSTRLPSLKARLVVQGESRTLEYAHAKMCEYNPAVRFFLCQPGSVFVRRPGKDGQLRGRWTVPDYLVVHERGCELVECKTLAELERKSTGEHPRFTRDGDRWRDLCAEEAAKEYGFQYRVFSSAEVNGIWIRNMDYVDDFDGTPDPDPVLGEKLLSALFQAGSMRIREALEIVDQKSAVLWWLIANRKAWGDLERERLWEPDTSWVHSSRSRMLAARELRGPVPDVAMSSQVSTVEVEVGSRILWNGVPYTILNRSDWDVTVRPDEEGRRSVAVPLSDFEEFLREGKIQGEASNAADTVVRRREELMRRATDKDLAEANRRYRLLQAYRETGVVPRGCGERTLRRLTKWAAEGLILYGSEICNLVRFRGRPAGTRDMGERQVEVLEEVARAFAKDIKAGRVAAAYARLVALCDERGISPVPSKGSLRSAAKRLSSPESTGEREGARRRYQDSGPVKKQDVGLPPTGDRVFHVVHIDSTLLDVQVVDSRNGENLGRPWFTVMEDDRSRMALAAVLTFEAPSRAVLAKLFADCVGRHNRLPHIVVVDRGSEFDSVQFEFVLASYKITKWERPPSKARFGSIIESFFRGNNSRFVHELLGNTKLTRGRQQSRTHDPARLAVWTLSGLHEILMQWLFQIYPQLCHGTLGNRPRDVFERDRALSGDRPSRYVAFNNDLAVVLAQPPDHGTTRHVGRTRGIVVGYLRFWHDDFKYGDVYGTNVPVKVNPFNCSEVFAYVRRRWVTCRLVDGDADLAGRSWKQIELAVEEISARRGVSPKSLVVNARVLGRFFREVEHSEQLRRQIRCEQEERVIGDPAFRQEEASDGQPMPKSFDVTSADEASDGTLGGSMPWLMSDETDEGDGDE